MLLQVHPKLPMRNKHITQQFYVHKLGFSLWGNSYDEYLMLCKDDIQIHFFAHPHLIPTQNYGQVYIRTNHIQKVYQQFLQQQVPIHPQGHLQLKPWHQYEFSVLDPDHNLLTFGQSV